MLEYLSGHWGWLIGVLFPWLINAITNAIREGIAYAEEDLRKNPEKYQTPDKALLRQLLESTAVAFIRKIPVAKNLPESLIRLLIRWACASKKKTAEKLDKDGGPAG